MFGKLMNSHVFCTLGKKLSLHVSQLACQARAYPGFCSLKQLGIFLLTPGWDASLLQGYPLLLATLNLPVLIYTPGWKKALRE